MHRPMILVLFLIALCEKPAAAQMLTGPFGPPEYMKRLILRTQLVVFHSEMIFDRARLPAHQRCYAAAQTQMAADSVAHALALFPRSPKRDALRTEISALANRFQEAVKDDGRTNDAMRFQLVNDCRTIAKQLDQVVYEVEHLTAP
jgi:hypothetical protein